MRIKIPTIPSGRCFTCVVFYTYYPVTSVRPYFQTVSSYAQTGQRNLLPIVRIFHLSRWIQFTEQLIIPQYLLADSGLVARRYRPAACRRRRSLCDKKTFRTWNTIKISFQHVRPLHMYTLQYLLIYGHIHIRRSYRDFHSDVLSLSSRGSPRENILKRLWLSVIKERFELSINEPVRTLD